MASPALHLIGVVIDGPAPLGRLTFRFHDGLTVFYGRNGAGKSKLLTAIASCLEGEHQPGGKSWLIFRCSDSEADLYDPDDPRDNIELMYLAEHLSREAVSIDRGAVLIDPDDGPDYDQDYDPDNEDAERIADPVGTIARHHLGVRRDDTEGMALVEEMTRQALFIAEPIVSAKPIGSTELKG